MGRRNLCFIGILLFLLLAGSCQRIEETSSTDRDRMKWMENNVNQVEMDVKPLNDDTEVSINIDMDDKYIRLDQAEEEAIALKDNQAIMVMDILNTYSGKDLAGVMKAFPAGSRIDSKGILNKELHSLFYYHEITGEIKERINGKSYGEDCSVPYEELRYIRVLHVGFDGNTYIGELIVNKALAEDIIDIFWELYELRYPIERMMLVDEYEADDDKSMAANNSSAFNFRHIAGTKRLSLHSRGLAIDINPLYNPYITTIDGEETVLPSEAMSYADRTLDNSYYIRKGDPCYEAFIRRGFTWGGEWENSKDYQHFQKVLEE